MAQLQFDLLSDEIGITEQPEFIRDIDCRPDTPVVHGVKPEIIYGKGIEIYPRVPGRQNSNHDRNVYLPHLDPLESYDVVLALFSAGKDSVASVLNLIELGVPKEKIVLIHHDLDGGSDKRVDWPLTKPYCKAFAEAIGIPSLRFSYREQGFFGELFRKGASHPVVFEDADGTLKRKEPKAWERSQELKELIRQAEIEDNMENLEAYETELRSYGYRFKFPAKAADLETRYCSAKLKIEVCSVAIAHQLDTKMNCKILVVSGERRGESVNRSRYNMMELHRTHAPTRNKRIVHHFRNVIDFSERDVWEVLRRNRVVPHACYSVGWSRASCSCCIFSGPSHFKGLQEILPDTYNAIRSAEIELGFTLDAKKNLDEYVGNAKSCVDRSNARALHQLVTGEITPEDIILPDGVEWTFPAGAFRHAETAGPC